LGQHGYLDATRLRLLCVLYALYSSRSVSERVDKYLYQLADIILLDCGLCSAFQERNLRGEHAGEPLSDCGQPPSSYFFNIFCGVCRRFPSSYTRWALKLRLILIAFYQERAGAWGKHWFIGLHNRFICETNNNILISLRYVKLYLDTCGRIIGLQTGWN